MSDERWTKEEANIKFLVYQLEQGSETGYMHFQGFVITKDSRRMAYMKKLFGEGHYEACKGKDEQCIAYCTKNETRVSGPYQWGKVSSQGERTDLEAIVEKIKDGVNMDEIAVEHPQTYIRLHRGIKEYASVELKRRAMKEFRKLEVVVHWGKAGAGKTRSVFDKHGFENVYVCPHPTNGAVWFDGYVGQPVLLIDDFKNWLTHCFMLRVLDGYPLQLAVKGGFTYANWSTVYITANTPPEAWYPNLSDEEKAALARRLTEVKYFDLKTDTMTRDTKWAGNTSAAHSDFGTNEQL